MVERVSVKQDAECVTAIMSMVWMLFENALERMKENGE